LKLSEKTALKTRAVLAKVYRQPNHASRKATLYVRATWSGKTTTMARYSFLASGWPSINEYGNERELLRAWPECRYKPE